MKMFHVYISSLDVWCEDIELGTELQILRQSRTDDHLVLVFDQTRHRDPKVRKYFFNSIKII